MKEERLKKRLEEINEEKAEIEYQLKNIKKKSEAERLLDFKKTIQEDGLRAIQRLFSITKEEIEAWPKELIDTIHKQAWIGLQFSKNLSIDKRAVEKNYITIFRLIAEDKEELKRLITESLPHYYCGEDAFRHKNL